MESSERMDVHARLVKNENLTVFAKGALLDVLNEIEPDLVQAFGVPVWEEDALYVTEEGLARKKEEFRDLMEVKLPKNFQDIGRAAAFGDLSENAEYTAALEERDHLTKRAAKMKSELDKAKVIGSDMVKDGVAGLGSRIRLRNLATGDETVYSLLGPWDGGPEDGVLSYLSPLGRTFVGKRAGDTVEAQLPGGVEKYELVETRSYFDAGA
jgi:transcription elongation GreA/GreB family factor